MFGRTTSKSLYCICMLYIPVYSVAATIFTVCSGRLFGVLKCVNIYVCVVFLPSHAQISDGFLHCFDHLNPLMQTARSVVEFETAKINSVGGGRVFVLWQCKKGMRNNLITITKE